MFSLIKKGGALKPAGVIKPAEIGNDPTLIGHQVAVRLYPDFHAAKYVIWRLEDGADALAEIANVTFAQYGNPVKPLMRDLRTDATDNCTENCWYILNMTQQLPADLEQKTKTQPTAEIHIQYFKRDEVVPEVCETQKILSTECMRPISVREVRRKMKTEAPHFFMQRYQQSQFYLFIERGR